MDANQPSDGAGAIEQSMIALLPCDPLAIKVLKQRDRILARKPSELLEMTDVHRLPRSVRADRQAVEAHRSGRTSHHCPCARWSDRAEASHQARISASFKFSLNISSGTEGEARPASVRLSNRREPFGLGPRRL